MMKTFCSLCNLWLNSQDQLSAHQSGRPHKRREALGIVITDQTKTYVQLLGRQESNHLVISQNNNQHSDGNDDIKQDGVPGQNGPSRLETSKTEEYFCNICVVKLTSQSQADMHYGGSKHRKALAVIAGKNEGKEYEGMKENTEDICELCNVSLPSKVIADAHYAGSKHEKKMKLSQSLHGILYPDYGGDVSHPSAGMQSYPVSSPAASIHSQIVPFSSPVALPITSGAQLHKVKALNLIFCSLCKISVNSPQQMDAHRKGMKHKNTVNGVVAQPKNTFTPRPASYHDRFVTPGHFYSPDSYGSPNGVVGFRARHPVGYTGHQY